MADTSPDVQIQALTAIRRRINELRQRIEADSNALQKLERAETFFTANSKSHPGPSGNEIASS